MAPSNISRPFAYNNTGLPISGTTSYDTLVVGDIETDYSSDYGGIKWWGGPEESEILGYVIGNIRPSGQPVPPGVVGTGTVGFWRSKVHTDQSFLDLANYIGAKNGQPPFATTTDAENWLQSNGYYTSFNLPTPTPTPTAQSTPTPTPTVTNTQTPSTTPTNTPSVTASQTATVTNTQTPSTTPTNTTTPTPSITASQTQTQTPTRTGTPTPTITASQTQTQTPTRTGTPTPTNINAQGFSYSNFASTTGLVGVGNAQVISNIYYLTTASNSQVGNVYRTTAIQYNKNFSVSWSTFIGGGTGADGYCVQWTPTNNTNGSVGGGVGLISTAINAITFLTYSNNNYTWYKNNVSQGVDSVTAGLWRQTLYFWGDYNHSAQTFALYWNTTNSKPVSANKTFTSFVFDTGSYYMGFGAATGGANDNQELLSWTLQFT